MANCPQCAGKMDVMTIVCPHCGYDFPAKERRHPAMEPACSICGGDAYTWGWVQGHYPLGFREDNGGMSNLFFGKEIKARVCTTCGNTQLFTF